jgi:hypothetical protein
MTKNRPLGVSSHGVKFTLMFAGITMLYACASSVGTLAKGDKDNPVILSITWDTTDECKITRITPDANICQSTHAEFCMPRSKWVKWQSTSEKGLQVYFSPFTTGNDGKTKRKIDDHAPYAVYKYTILAEGCNRDTQANDPGIRVDR